MSHNRSRSQLEKNRRKREQEKRRKQNVAAKKANEAQQEKKSSSETAAWSSGAMSALFSACGTASTAAKSLSDAAFRKLLTMMITSSVVAAYSFDGDSGLCGTFNTDCRDATVYNASGSAEFLRDIDSPVFGSEPDSNWRSVLRSCLSIDGDNMEKFVSGIIDRYGFGGQSCAVEDTFHKWIVEFLIEGIGAQADCQQINAEWAQTVEQCDSLDEILAAAAKAGIAIGVILVVAAAGAGIYYACKKGISCPRPTCLEDGKRESSDPAWDYA